MFVLCIVVFMPGRSTIIHVSFERSPLTACFALHCFAWFTRGALPQPYLVISQAVLIFRCLEITNRMKIVLCVCTLLVSCLALPSELLSARYLPSFTVFFAAVVWGNFVNFYPRPRNA